MHSWNKSVTMSMLRAREALMERFRPILAEHGLTEPQWRVLRALSEVDELPITETAELTMLLAPSVTRIVKDLEARKLIQRTAHGLKPNQYHLRILPAGTKLIDLVAPKADACIGGLTSQFGRKRMEELQKLLEDFAALKAGRAR